MNYMSVSFTHKNTDISQREKLSFARDDEKKHFLNNIILSNFISEALILSTCNRVEIFVITNDLSNAQEVILNELSAKSGVNLSELNTHADIYENDGAIHHLFSVACSLDSLVIGETQIVGQLKNAFIFAYKNGFAKLNISRAMHYAFKCAANVRNSTDISKNQVSISSVAVAKAKEIFGDISQMDAVVIGCGEMSELACKYLIANGAKVTILNRTLERAKNLALALGCSYDSISKIKEYINKFSLIFSATSSPNPIITNDLIEKQTFKRYFFDIAVPRDIEISTNSSVFVFAVDDLDEIVKQNIALREEQAQVAYAMIGEMTREFFKWLQTLASTPIIKALRFYAKEIAEQELNKAIKKGYIRHCDEEEVKKLIHQIFKAFLHTPTINLKNLGNQIEADAIIRSIKYIFDIKDKFDEFNFYKCEYQWEKDSEI